MSFANLRAPSGHRLCRHLRCKEMYYNVPESLERAKENPTRAFEHKHFWCLKTFKAESPDGATCNAEECKPTRSCYEP